jgi:hypothetical protein
LVVYERWDGFNRPDHVLKGVLTDIRPTIKNAVDVIAFLQLFIKFGADPTAYLILSRSGKDRPVTALQIIAETVGRNFPAEAALLLRELKQRGGKGRLPWTKIPGSLLKKRIDPWRVHLRSY